MKNHVSLPFTVIQLMPFFDVRILLYIVINCNVCECTYRVLVHVHAKLMSMSGQFCLLSYLDEKKLKAVVWLTHGLGILP